MLYMYIICMYVIYIRLLFWAKFCTGRNTVILIFDRCRSGSAAAHTPCHSNDAARCAALGGLHQIAEIIGTKLLSTRMP